MLAQSMRPKFKTGIYAIPVPGGVYLRGNNSQLMLKGKSLYALLEHLIPHLNGDTTLAEITSGLDAERKKMVTHLIEKLFAHQFLQDPSQDQSHTLSAQKAETYASNLAFIESFQTSAAYRFECFRHKRLLIFGAGPVLTALVQASLQGGVKQISASVASADERAFVSPEDFRASFAGYDAEQSVQLIHTPCWDNEVEVRNTIQACDAVLHFSEQPMLARAQLLNRLCVEEQKPCMQAILVGDHAWIGPLVCSETTGCWECAWRRLQANLTTRSEQLSHFTFRDQPQTPGSRFLTMPVISMLANRLIFALFTYFTQTGTSATAGHLSVLDLATGLSENHAFLPHPHCQVCQRPVVPTASHFLERIQQLQHLDPIGPDTLLERINSGVVDARTGLLTSIEDDDFVQAPLAVFKATLSNPLCKEKGPETFTLVAADVDTQAARLHVFQKACTRYAAHLVDQQRLLPSELVEHHAFPPFSAEQLIGIRPPACQDKRGIWALDMQTQQASIVPAIHVFPALSQQDQGIECEQGVAAGMSWEEATCQALLDWARYLTIEHMQHTQQAYLQVDLTQTSLTPEGNYLYHLLQTTVEQKVAVYDLTGPLRIPTFATCLAEKVVAYQSHCDAKQALRLGFERALQQYQAEQSQQDEYAVAPVPDFPLALRSEQLSVPHSTLPDAWPARQAWLLQRFQAYGLQALAIPLDHDPALVQMLPFIVRVLLYKTEPKKGE